MRRNHTANYRTGALLLSVENDEILVVLNDSSGPHVGQGRLIENTFEIPLALIGGLPPTATASGRIDPPEIAVSGSITASNIELRNEPNSHPQAGRYQGTAQSMVNGGSVPIIITVNDEGHLDGEIVTPSGSLVMEGTVTPRGLTQVGVKGVGHAEGQTGTLFGNLLPSPDHGFVGTGIYTGGAGDYGTWLVTRDPDAATIS